MARRTIIIALWVSISKVLGKGILVFYVTIFAIMWVSWGILFCKICNTMLFWLRLPKRQSHFIQCNENFCTFSCSEYGGFPIILQIYGPDYLWSWCFSSWNLCALSIPSLNSYSKGFIFCKTYCSWEKQYPGMLSSIMHTSLISLFVLFCLFSCLSFWIDWE